MPPRGFAIAIVVFWIGTTCALFVYEVLPRWRAGEAPALKPELTDEIGSPQVVWEVFQNDKQIGRGFTHVRRQPDRTFEMSQRFAFFDLQTSLLDKSLSVKKLDTTYRITREGQLLGLKISGQAEFDGSAVNGDVEGDVVDGVLALKLRAGDVPIGLGSFGSIRVDERGSMLNPMQLLHRLPDLREGQTWIAPLFDPLKMFSYKSFLTGSPRLEAKVSVGVLDWNQPNLTALGQRNVECFRISYRESRKGREPDAGDVAQTWVRRSDGLVLAQQSQQRGQSFFIRRLPESQGSQ